MPRNVFSQRSSDEAMLKPRGHLGKMRRFGYVVFGLSVTALGVVGGFYVLPHADVVLLVPQGGALLILAIGLRCIWIGIRPRSYEIPSGN